MTNIGFRAIFMSLGYRFVWETTTYGFILSGLVKKLTNEFILDPPECMMLTINYTMFINYLHYFSILSLNYG